MIKGIASVLMLLAIPLCPWFAFVVARDAYRREIPDIVVALFVFAAMLGVTTDVWTFAASAIHHLD